MDSVPAAGATVFQLLSDDCCDGVLFDGGALFEELEEATEGQLAMTWSLDPQRKHLQLVMPCCCIIDQRQEPGKWRDRHQHQVVSRMLSWHGPCMQQANWAQEKIAGQHQLVVPNVFGQSFRGILCGTP